MALASTQKFASYFVKLWDCRAHTLQVEKQMLHPRKQHIFPVTQQPYCVPGNGAFKQRPPEAEAEPPRVVRVAAGASAQYLLG